MRQVDIDAEETRYLTELRGAIALDDLTILNCTITQPPLMGARSSLMENAHTGFPHRYSYSA